MHATHCYNQLGHVGSVHIVTATVRRMGCTTFIVQFPMCVQGGVGSNAANLSNKN